MTQTRNWNYIAQWLVVLICALALKQYYSGAGANELRWILLPTAACVELVSGVAFEFESHAGYISGDRSFLIAPSCSGVNFLITAFLMLSVGKLWRDRSRRISWTFIPVSLVISFLATVAANSVRIEAALRSGSLQDVSGMDYSRVHRVEGILVYFAFLLLLFVVSERVGRGEGATALRHLYFPVLIYYAMMFGVPLLNGAYRQGPGFWEHSSFVLVIPLLVILPFTVLGLVRRSQARQG